MTNRTVVDTVKLALYELSTKDPDEIATALFEAGFCGVRKVPWSCPIANYLKEVLEKAGTPCWVSVGEEDVWVRPDKPGSEEFVVALPYTVRQFVKRFDYAEYYPELKVDDEDE